MTYKNKEKLISYYEFLCRKLNENSFKSSLFYNNQLYQSDFEVDYDHPDLTMMAITDNIEAYHFLRKEGFIRKDMCHFCGQMLESNEYKFIEPSNGIKIDICKDCHPKGASSSVGSSGCMFAILYISIPIVLYFSILFFL